MTALLLFGLLVGLVLVCIYMFWDLDLTLRREVRHGRLEAKRAERRAEDQAWQEWLLN